MRTVKVGQVWEVYSSRARQWGRATVVELENGVARLRYDEQPEDLTCEAAIIAGSRDMFRLLEDVSDK